MKILLLDDEIALTTVLEQLLLQAGHEVLAFTNAELALKALSDFQPDAVVSDFSMPIMNGLDFFNQAKQVWQGAFYLMTGDTFSDVEQLKKQGIREIFFKPADLFRLPIVLGLLNEEIS